MKHIVAALILALVMHLTQAARLEAPRQARRCHDVSALHGASVFVR
ncbi:MAG: hypothetical protein M3041_02625 [Acidobacteriota bacterium]|nr:hypothetical protein [Acidobacteriota bacterium]